MARNADAKKHFALNFYCHWAVHTKLDRSGAARIVKRFDKYQERTELSLSTPEGTVPEADLGVLNEVESTVKLERFRSQLAAYLERNDLPNHVAKDDGQWANFLSYCFHVIEDCPLICRAKLQHVGEVAVGVIETHTGADAQRAGYSVKVAWEWQPLQSPIFTRHVSTF